MTSGAPNPTRQRAARWHRPATYFLTVAVLAAIIWWFVSGALAGLNARGIRSGFGFLSQPAGFDVGFKLIRFSVTDNYARAFLVGLLNTLLVSGVAIGLSTIAGFGIGILRLSRSIVMSRMMAVYVDVVRSCPLLLQIFFWYFAVLGTLPNSRNSLAFFGVAFLNNRGLFVPEPMPEPGFWLTPLVLLASAVALTWLRRRALLPISTGLALTIGPALLVLPAALVFMATGTPLAWSVPSLQGFNFAGGLNLVPEFLALVLAITVYASAFIGEVVRAGLLSVGSGTREAARALGLPTGLTMRLVVLPLAMRAIVPPLTNQYLTIIKYSSLAAAIGYPDLVQIFGKTVLNQTGQAIEVLSMIAATYLAISLAAAAFMNWFNDRMALVGRS